MFSDDFIKTFVYGVLLLGITVYLVIIGAYLVGKIWPARAQWAVRLLEGGGGVFTLGLPIAGFVTTAIVYVFAVTSPGSAVDKYTFQAFSLQFSGPAAPATIWIVIFLTFVAAIRIFRP